LAQYLPQLFIVGRTHRIPQRRPERRRTSRTSGGVEMTIRETLYLLCTTHRSELWTLPITLAAFALAFGLAIIGE